MRPRRDAQRNRERLVAAGRAVFTEQGVDASLEEIARRAGVGIGTLYRHFPSREALVAAIFEERIGEVLAAAERAAAAEDAWQGLVGFLEQALQLQADHLALRQLVLRYPQGDAKAAAARRKIHGLLEELVERARDQGAVRADLNVADLVLVIWSFGPLLEATAGTAPQAWRRHLRIVLDGLRPEAATPQTVRPLTRRQLDAAMQTLRGRLRRGVTA